MKNNFDDNVHSMLVVGRALTYEPDVIIGHQRVHLVQRHQQPGPIRNSGMISESAISWNITAELVVDFT